MPITRSLSWTLVAGAALLLVADSAHAQDLDPSRRLSPVGIAKTHLGQTYVKVTYSRPYTRDREIFGDPDEGTYLVPYGALWRTGANEATELATTGPLLIAGERLEAGTYSVFTVPGPTSWTIRFNTQLGMDGTGRLDPVSGEFAETYDAGDDVLAVDVPSGTLDEDVDQFTITFEPIGSPTHMVLSWERTEVRIPVEAAGS